MTAMEIILLFILMVTNIVLSVIIWKQRLAIKGLKQASTIVVSALAQQLHFLQMSMNNSPDAPQRGSNTIH